MGIGSLFDSSSRTDQRLKNLDLNNSLGADNGANAFLSSLGGLDIQVSGKKNKAYITNNIQMTDGGALKLAENIVSEGYEVTSEALASAGEALDASNQTALRAIDFAETRSASEGLDLMKSFGKFAVVGGVVFGLVFVFRKGAK